MKKSMAYIEMFVVVIVVIITSIVAVSMYSASQKASCKAKELNNGSGICTNIMDCYISSNSEEEFSEKLKALGYYVIFENDTYKVNFNDSFISENNKAAYTAVLSIADEPSDVGTLQNITVSFNKNAEELYTLSSYKYRSDK